MPRNTSMPHTVAEVISDRSRFDPAALAAVKALARSKPWQGTNAERLEKFRTCAAAVAVAYGFNPPDVVISDADGFEPTTNRIVLTEKLSVVTFLHILAIARDPQLTLGLRERFRWSLNLFKRCFPRSYSRLTPVGPFLVRPGDAPPLGELPEPFQDPSDPTEDDD